MEHGERALGRRFWSHLRNRISGTLTYLRDSGGEEVNHSVKERMKVWTISVCMTWVPECVMKSQIKLRYTGGQISIWKVGRDIKMNLILDNKFEMPVAEERMSKLKKWIYMFLCISMHM